MKWFKINFVGVEGKDSSARGFLIKFVSLLVRYDALNHLRLYHKNGEISFSSVTCYYISCPDEISDKVLLSLSTFDVNEIEQPDFEELFKLLGN